MVGKPTSKGSGLLLGPFALLLFRLKK